jgi:hypothetical protein
MFHPTRTIIKIQEDFREDEIESTAIVLEHESKERVLKDALYDVYTKPYVLKVFDAYGNIEYYRIQDKMTG